MNRKILITGATGFVGRQVLLYLSKSEVCLKAVLRPNRSLPQGIGVTVEIVESADLFRETREWWTNVLMDVDTVVHVAWYAEPGKYLQSEKNLDCLSGTLEMAKACVSSGVRRFVGVGTCSEYDLSHGLLSTKTPLSPLNPYAASKAATYIMLSQWFAVQQVAFAWCRLFYLHGEGEDSRRLVPYLRTRLEAREPAELTSGNQIRDFLDVKDAGREIAEVALSEMQGAFNICSGIPITVRQLAEQIADEYGRRDLLHFGARPENLFDPPLVVGVKSDMPS